MRAQPALLGKTAELSRREEGTGQSNPTEPSWRALGMQDHHFTAPPGSGKPAQPNTSEGFCGFFVKGRP